MPFQINLSQNSPTLSGFSQGEQTMKDIMLTPSQLKAAKLQNAAMQQQMQQRAAAAQQQAQLAPVTLAGDQARTALTTSQANLADVQAAAYPGQQQALQAQKAAQLGLIHAQTNKLLNPTPSNPAQAWRALTTQEKTLAATQVLNLGFTMAEIPGLIASGNWGYVISNNIHATDYRKSQQGGSQQGTGQQPLSGGTPQQQPGVQPQVVQPQGGAQQQIPQQQLLSNLLTPPGYSSQATSPQQVLQQQPQVPQGTVQPQVGTQTGTQPVSPDASAQLGSTASTQAGETQSILDKAAMGPKDPDRLKAAARAYPIIQDMSQNVGLASQYAGWKRKGLKIADTARESNAPSWKAYNFYNQQAGLLKGELSQMLGLPATSQGMKEITDFMNIDSAGTNPQLAVQKFNNLANMLHQETVPTAETIEAARQKQKIDKPIVPSTSSVAVPPTTPTTVTEPKGGFLNQAAFENFYNGLTDAQKEVYANQLKASEGS